MTDRMKPARAVLAVLASFLRAFRVEILEVVAVVLIVGGVAMWSLPVALVVAGVAVLLIAHPPIVRGRS